jgi:hypothetical protein
MRYRRIVPYYLRKLTYLYSRVIYKLGCTFKSTLSLVMYNKESFIEHYRGPDYAAAVEEFSNFLKWEYKAGRQIDPWEAREKLSEILYNRGIRW